MVVFFHYTIKHMQNKTEKFIVQLHHVTHAE